MANLYPYIYCDNAKEQADFYVKALAGEILMVKTFAELPNAPIDQHLKDKIMHLRLRAAGLMFFMSDSIQEPVERGNGMDLTLEFQNEEEAGRVFEGLAAGGTVIMPLAKQFWGSMSGRVKDPYGICWQITT
ncbi:MAG: VOC family protein [Methylocystaceae bacterium]